MGDAEIFSASLSVTLNMLLYSRLLPTVTPYMYNKEFLCSSYNRLCFLSAINERSISNSKYGKQHQNVAYSLLISSAGFLLAAYTIWPKIVITTKTITPITTLKNSHKGILVR